MPVEEDFQAEHDMRVLAEAQEIQASDSRLRRARRAAEVQAERAKRLGESIAPRPRKMFDSSVKNSRFSR